MPSVSGALAAILIVAGEVNVEPATGLVSVTTGATLAGGFTATLTAEDVVTLPMLSVAFAVIVYEPAAHIAPAHCVWTCIV